MNLKKLSNSQKTLMLLGIIGICCSCAAVLFPQVRDFTILIGEKIIGRRFNFPLVWNNQIVLWALYGLLISCSVVIMSLKAASEWKSILNDEGRLRVICLIVLLTEVILFSWQCDDAYHSHKMSINFADGKGLVYNAGERVSASTEPLNTLIVGITYKIFGHIYLSSLILNIVFSALAIFMLLKYACKTTGHLWLATIMLSLCSSFISYTTSGLENALLFFLFALLLHIFLSRDVFSKKDTIISAFLCSLIFMARMDNALLAFPIMLHIIIKRNNVNIAKKLLLAFLGFLPFVIWEIFSIVYYGFPFPNTVYAKLGTNFGLLYYLKHGIRYFYGSLTKDPLVFLPSIVLLIFSFNGKSARQKAVCLSLIVYYAYILYIGGDFMRGRHFTVPFFIACYTVMSEYKFRLPLLQFSNHGFELSKNVHIKLNRIAACIFVLFLGSILFLLKLAPAESGWDERRTQSPYSSLINRSLYKLGIHSYTITDFSPNLPNGNQEESIELLALARKNGYVGDIMPFVSGIFNVYHKGISDFYLTDDFALQDPLRARLPASLDKSFMIGHMIRDIPDGYRESIQTGKNKIVDPYLHEYLDILWDITRSEKLFTGDRLQKIININLGRYDYLIDKYLENQKMKNNANEEAQ